MNTTCRPIIFLCVLSLAFVRVSALAADNDIKLSKPAVVGKVSLEVALIAKKSVRNFTGEPLAEAQISQILWAANGNLPPDAVAGATYKVIPSAGGLYPLEIFLVTGKDTVSGIPEGVYSYDPLSNSLKLLAPGDNRTLLSHASLSQMWLARAPALVVIGAVFARTTSKYGNRGSQYVFMEAGSSNQNVYLQAEALGLHVGTVGAFNDAQVSAVLKLPSSVTPLLVMAIGK
ncbi:MAG: SagB/ThcOx family dehydrogenase [Desulfomonile sp.]|jgi:SagB-type dehydrogenase family enzyme|nr:SagB/ThcOx family dehydrogenase [Deltaproteobacteria bacterium]